MLALLKYFKNIQRFIDMVSKIEHTSTILGVLTLLLVLMIIRLTKIRSENHAKKLVLTYKVSGVYVASNEYF